MGRTRQLIKDLLPPVLLRALQRGRRLAGGAPPPAWEYVPGGWETASAAGSGWSSPSIAEKQVAHWPRFLALVGGRGALGIAHEAATLTDQNVAAHNTVMSFAYVLGRAATGRRTLSLLDWGGGIGHYHAFARALYPELEIDYVCVDLPGLVEAGRRLQPEATYAAGDEALERKYDVVMASGSLHCVEDWRALAARLSRAAGAWLYVTRVPVVESAASFVVLQRPHAVGYATEYLGWFLNRHELLREIEAHGLELVREFLIDERPRVLGAPEQAAFRGFLFAAKRGSANAGDSR